MLDWRGSLVSAALLHCFSSQLEQTPGPSHFHSRIVMLQLDALATLTARQKNCCDLLPCELSIFIQTLGGLLFPIFFKSSYEISVDIIDFKQPDSPVL